ELDAELAADGGDPAAVFLGLLAADAVFAHEMLGGVLAFRRQVRVQLERLPVDLELQFARQLLHGQLQPLVADHAPGADDIGDNIQANCSHDSFHFVAGGWIALSSMAANGRAGNAGRESRALYPHLADTA